MRNSNYKKAMDKMDNSEKRMNCLSRMKNAIKNQPVDFPPSIFIATSAACQLTGIKQGDWSTDPKLLSQSLIKLAQLCDSDGIYVTRDNTVTHQAMGGKVIFPEDNEPMGQQPVLSNLKDFHKLDIPDPNDAAGMKTVITAARMVKEQIQDDRYVVANIDCGPFSTAANLRGVQNFLMDISIEDPKLIHDYLRFCTELVIAYGKSMQKTGVHGIQYGDSAASLISPEMFKQYALPYEEQSIDALKSDQCDFWLHICGETGHLINLFNDLTNLRVFEIDAMVPMAKARESFRDDIALKGNLDTVFLQDANADDVYSATCQMIKSYGKETGLVVSAGCGVPRNTPLENLRAMIRACRDNAFSG